MAREYEIVTHSQLRYMHVFLVRLISRTTHIHREMELGMILDGNVALHIGEERYRLEQGDIYCVNPLEAHEFVSEDPGTLVLSIQLSPGMLEGLIPDILDLRLMGSAKLRDHYSDPAGFDMLSLLFLEIAHAYLGCEAHFEYKCLASAAEFLYLLKRDVPALQVLRDKTLSRRAERLLAITDYIEENFTHKLLLEDIAKREGLSMTYLSHLFKESLGVTFQDYIKEKRFEYACNLLAATDRKILDISVSSGFSDVRYLTKLVQERYGCTPKEFRNNARLTQKKHASPHESTQYFFTQQESYLLLTPLRNQLLNRLSGRTVHDFL